MRPNTIHGKRGGRTEQYVFTSAMPPLKGPICNFCISQRNFFHLYFQDTAEIIVCSFLNKQTNHFAVNNCLTFWEPQKHMNIY